VLRAARFALLLGLVPVVGCTVEAKRDVAWVRYDQDYARWQDDHARWERDKAARDRRAQRTLERQWPRPTAAAPDDPLAPEPLDERRAPVSRRSSGGSSVGSGDWTPPPPDHYVPEDERVVVEQPSSVEADVGYGGYGAYVGPSSYRRSRVIGSYPTIYARSG
jgi:hypothetical protein